MSLMVISQQQVRKHLTLPVCIELMEQAFLATSSGKTIQPLRKIHELPNGRGFGLMPGYMDAPNLLGAKVTAVYPENFDKGLQSHQGGVLLFDGSEGKPIALVHGGEVTAIRTAAASAAATKQLARPDSKALAILGYGEQAQNHIFSMMEVRPIETVKVWGRNVQKRDAFCVQMSEKTGLAFTSAPDVESAVSGADIVCTTTAAREPILKGSWLEEGMHLNVVGSSTPDAREIDNQAVKCSQFYVDYRYSALSLAGEFLRAKEGGVVEDTHIVAEIGEILAGTKHGRRNSSDITMYKSLGHSAQDLVTAHYLYETLATDKSANWSDF